MGLLFALIASGAVAAVIAACWVAYKLDRCLDDALHLGE